MIAVVIFLQSLVSLVKRPSVSLCQGIYLGCEVVDYFIFCDSTDSGVFGQETKVAQIVKGRKERHLSELCYASDKNELLILVGILQYGKHIAVHFCAILVLGSVPRMLKRRIVFVNKYSYLLTSGIVCCNDNVLKAHGKRHIRHGPNAILLLVFAECRIKIIGYALWRGSCHTHIKTYDGIFYPVCLHVCQPQSLKQVATGIEIGIERVNKQRLAKPSRPAQIVELNAVVHHPPHYVGLVDIDVVLSPYLHKRLYAYRESSYWFAHNLIMVSISRR